MDTNRFPIAGTIQKLHHHTKIVIRVMLLLLLVLLVLFIGYVKLFPRANYSDAQYGFSLSKLQNWKQLPPKDGAYVSFAIINGNKVISYADVRPLKKSSNQNFSKEQAQKNCNDIEKEVKGQKAVFSDSTINNAQGYVCTIEAQGSNTQELLLITQYTLTSDSGTEYLYVLSASYPKNNLTEKQNVENFISGFTIL